MKANKFLDAQLYKKGLKYGIPAQMVVNQIARGGRYFEGKFYTQLGYKKLVMEPNETLTIQEINNGQSRIPSCS